MRQWRKCHKNRMEMGTKHAEAEQKRGVRRIGGAAMEN
jgi:hypothetical protein